MLLTMTMRQRPIISATFHSNGQTCALQALLHTGADITTVAKILIAQPEPFTTEQETFLDRTLQNKGLVIAPEKVQCEPLLKYLGWTITQSQISPKKLELHTDM